MGEEDLDGGVRRYKGREGDACGRVQQGQQEGCHLEGVVALVGVEDGWVVCHCEG
jgi:hypothetical protein